MSRADRIEAFASGAARVREAWQAVPEGARKARPEPGEWSPHELVIHMADADVNGYLRFRKLVAEPGSTVPGYEQDRWAEELHYHSQDPESALALMDLIRRMTHPLLSALADDDWNHTVTHTERGSWTMDDWLRTYTDHVDAHLEQMREAVAVWRRAGEEA